MISIELEDNSIFNIIDIYNPEDRIRDNLFNLLKNTEYNPDYISRFTGQPINQHSTIKNIFKKIKEEDIKKFIDHPNIVSRVYELQLGDYLASLYKDGDPITKGEEWIPCNKCGILFASKGGFELHLKIKKCKNL